MIQISEVGLNSGGLPVEVPNKRKRAKTCQRTVGQHSIVAVASIGAIEYRSPPVTRSLEKVLPQAEGLVALKYLMHSSEMPLLENARKQREVSQHRW